jgi:uncharacterized membrane protein
VHPTNNLYPRSREECGATSAYSESCWTFYAVFNDSHSYIIPHPSVRKRQRARSSVIGLGVGISSYLTYVHYGSVTAVCPFNARCDVVLSSPYAQMWGVPLSLLGLLMYAVLTTMGFWLWRAQSRWERLIALGAYTVALSGTLFTGYLYYLEIFELHAFCSWCVASSVVIVGILALSLINFFAVTRRLEKRASARRFKLSRYIGW